MNETEFSEWGRPFITASTEFGIAYRCFVCGATWFGPIGDFCEWCHSRWAMHQDLAKRKLLFPEWLEWGERYFKLSPVDRRVWEETRWIHRGFEAKWQDAIFNALGDSVITDIEAVQALRRYERWKTHMQEFDN